MSGVLEAVQRREIVEAQGSKNQIAKSDSLLGRQEGLNFAHFVVLNICVNKIADRLLARQDAFLSDIIASASCLFALYNSKDINSRAAAAFAVEAASERMLLPEIVCKLHHGGGREAPGSLARESPSTQSVNNGAKRVKKQNTPARVTTRTA